jgi:hypothetical protein
MVSMLPSELRCPTTGNQIFLDTSVFLKAGPKGFVCPSCDGLHEWRNEDGRVIDWEVSGARSQPASSKETAPMRTELVSVASDPKEFRSKVWWYRNVLVEVRIKIAAFSAYLDKFFE